VRDEGQGNGIGNGEGKSRSLSAKHPECKQRIPQRRPGRRHRAPGLRSGPRSLRHSTQGKRDDNGKASKGKMSATADLRPAHNSRRPLRGQKQRSGTACCAPTRKKQDAGLKAPALHLNLKSKRDARLQFEAAATRQQYRRVNSGQDEQTAGPSSARLRPRSG